MTRMALRAWRKQNGWTLEEAARFLGTTRTSVHRWEAGDYDVPQGVEILVILLHDKKNIRKVQNFLYSPLAQ